MDGQLKFDIIYQGFWEWNNRAGATAQIKSLTIHKDGYCLRICRRLQISSQYCTKKCHSLRMLKFRTNIFQVSFMIVQEWSTLKYMQAAHIKWTCSSLSLHTTQSTMLTKQEAAQILAILADALKNHSPTFWVGRRQWTGAAKRISMRGMRKERKMWKKLSERRSAQGIACKAWDGSCANMTLFVEKWNEKLPFLRVILL